MQLRYAADDVRYLPLVRDVIGRRLDALGHADWAAQESAAMCDADLYSFDPATQYLRVRGATSLQPRSLAVLRELTVWRDAAAREADVPPRAFLKDEIMIDMARSPIIDRPPRPRPRPAPPRRSGPRRGDCGSHAARHDAPRAPAPRWRARL
jgi:ribonuclease D